MEENMTENNTVWVTKVEEIEGAFAFDVPQPLFEHLNLSDGDRLVWMPNKDGTITIARFKD
jgi:hypothetical protein